MHHWILITGLHISCASKNEAPIQTANPPPPPIEPPPIQNIRPAPIDIRKSLPKWDDLSAPEQIKDPVEGLGLSADKSICYKEWFQGDSVPPSVRKFGGRILKEDENTIGRMIECPMERKQAFLNAYQKEED